MQGDAEDCSKRTWGALYLAAFFEADSTKLPERIAAAEYALGLRDRELWYFGGDHNEERHALTGAMRALEALRKTHQGPRPVPSDRNSAKASFGRPWRMR